MPRDDHDRLHLSRREFLGSALPIGLLALNGASAAADPPPRDKALIAITLDLEMSRNFPTWDQTHWDYEKGNLDAPTKRYAVEAARRVKAKGGLIHFFALGQTMEQEDVGWLKEIAAQGHPIGNHTYDHVNVKATRIEDVQFRFRRAPWLVEGKTPAEVIAGNIRLAELALKQRAGIAVSPASARPGGFNDGLSDRPDLQALLLKQGYHLGQQQVPRASDRPGRASRPSPRSWRHRRGPGTRPTVRLPFRAGRDPDEPDQRRHGLPHRPLAARSRSSRPSARPSRGPSNTAPSSASSPIPPAWWPPTPSSGPSRRSSTWFARRPDTPRWSTWEPSPAGRAGPVESNRRMPIRQLRRRSCCIVIS